MSDETKMEIESRDIINRTGMAMIAKKMGENGLSDNQSNDALSTLRTSPFIYFFSFF